MGLPNRSSTSIIPKISKKLAIRSVCLLVFVIGLIYGLIWFLKVRSDLGGLKTAETAGWISAIQYLPDGQQVVLISPDGKIHTDPDHKPHTRDSDVTWSPHGNFVFFVSDRNQNNFNLFRLSPSIDDSERADQRTTGTRARSNPKFSAQPTEDSDNIAMPLIASGGAIQQYDPSKQSTEQVLPPTSKEITTTQSSDNESGTAGEFEGEYGNLGTSFRIAQWCGNGKYIIGVMRRESGEVLVLQSMQPVDGKFPRPRPLTAGEHIDFDVSRADGNIVYTVQRFMWTDKPPLDKSGNPVPKPFVNGVVYLDLVKAKPEHIAQDKAVGFGYPAIRPDGKVVAVVFGKPDNGSIQSNGLFTLPLAGQKDFKSTPIQGDLHEPSWSPDGTHLVFVGRKDKGKRTIYDLRTDDGTMRSVTGDAGDFATPQFSPQIKGAS